MNLDELKKFQRDVERAIVSFEARRIAEARKALDKLAQDLGVTLEYVVRPTRGTPTKSAGVAKYRHPENPALTWTGRGRKPAWFSDAVASGKSPADLLIA